MKILLISVGKKHQEQLKDVIEEFTKRLSGYNPVEWQIITPKKAFDNAEIQKKHEAELILATLKPQDHIILLDEKGKEMSTIGLSELLEAKLVDGVSRLVFIIGGAYGVSEDVVERSQHVWSLSKLVFPHQIVRLILVEQLYRAFSVLNGGKYHHE